MTLGRLFTRSVGRHRAFLAGLAIVLGGFQFLIAIMAAEVQRSAAFGQLTALIPVAFQQALGGFAFASFAGLVSFGYAHPVVVLAFVEAAIFLGSEPAWEVEAGVVDLTMARPVPRRAIVMRGALVVTAIAAALGLCMALATRVALHWFAPPGAPWPPLRVTATLALNLGTVALCFGCVSLAVAGGARRRGTVLGTTGLAAIVLYLLNVIAPLWAPAQRVVWISPFHYYDAMGIISGASTRWLPDVAVLVAIAAAATAVAFVAYGRRDL